MKRKRRKGKFVSSKTVRNHIQLEEARDDRLGKVTFDEALAIIDCDDNDTESDTCPGDDHEEVNPEGICPNEEITPIKGSHIVNIGCILRQLHQGCVVCGVMLSIRNVQSEHIKGLASVWHILCGKCEGITNVHTSKWHTQKDSITRKKWAYNVNTKVAVGKYFHQGSIAT